jgi:phosphatidylglycerol phospholipase C
MFHDPNLERTTDQKGTIRERDWYGEDGMQHARTKKEPKQSIPTFEQTVELLMKVRLFIYVRAWIATDVERQA